MATFQTWLQHPRLRYALLVLVMSAALVALWRRVSDAPSLKPAAHMAVVTPQTIAPEPPKSLLAPAESLVGHAESLLATVGPEETVSTAVTSTPEFVKDPDKSQFAASLLAEPIEDALMAAPRVELSAPGKAASATPSE